MSRGLIAFGCLLAWIVVAVPDRVSADVPTLQTTLKSVVSVLPEWPRNVNRNKEPEGSGVVIIDGRTIVTAYHVVDRALSVRVRTSDGEILPAKVKAGDPATDLALLTVERDLPPLEFGGDAVLGDAICAIGNAFGKDLSVTCGVVSAVHRAGMGFYSIEDFVQVDAAINPGASGGALIDAGGNLIGILAGIFTRGEYDANIGVNFAIAAPLAEKVTGELFRNDKIAWRGTGAALADVPPSGEVGEQAAEVKYVRADTPASRAGLEKGDRIVKANDRRIRRAKDFLSVMARQTSGARVALTVRRGNETRELQLVAE